MKPKGVGRFLIIITGAFSTAEGGIPASALARLAPGKGTGPGPVPPEEESDRFLPNSPNIPAAAPRAAPSPRTTSTVAIVVCAIPVLVKSILPLGEREDPIAVAAAVPIGGGARGSTREVYPCVPFEGRSPGGENVERSAVTSDWRVCGGLRRVDAELEEECWELVRESRERERRRRRASGLDLDVCRRLREWSVVVLLDPPPGVLSLSCLLEPLEPYSISRCAIRGVSGPSSSSSIKADMPPFMFDVGLGFGFRVRAGGVMVDLGGLVDDVGGGEEEDEGFELRWVFVVDVELALDVWEMGWGFLVSEEVGLGRSFFWGGMEDVEEERACPWLVRDVVLVLVLVGELVALELVFVTTVVELEP